MLADTDAFGGPDANSGRLGVLRICEGDDGGSSGCNCSCEESRCGRKTEGREPCRDGDGREFHAVPDQVEDEAAAYEFLGGGGLS